jgi:hypothetical protein
MSKFQLFIYLHCPLTIYPSNIISAISTTLSSLKPFVEEATSKLDSSMSDESGNAQARSLASSGFLADFILETLSFKSMKNREEEVADAHGDTFDWVFNHSSDDSGQSGIGEQFTTWLQSDDLGSIYWGMSHAHSFSV